MLGARSKFYQSAVCVPASAIGRASPVAYNARAAARPRTSPERDPRARTYVIGFTLLALLALAIAVVLAYRAGAASARRTARPVVSGEATPVARIGAAARAPGSPVISDGPSALAVEQSQLAALAEDRRRLRGELADARAETARYRQIVVDIERNAPPPLLDAPGTPDDLKLIVGIGPVIERMLYQLGIATYRQIARWSERDIDDIDARLKEFPGRIRRDGWVTQARALHIGKYGNPP
jgi:predicted flap endonuclease-1-like 5' DNA nuclease